MYYHYSTFDYLLDTREGDARLFYGPTVVTLDLEGSNQHCIFSFEQCPCLRANNFLRDNAIHVCFSITISKMIDLIIFIEFFMIYVVEIRKKKLLKNYAFLLLSSIRILKSQVLKNAIKLAKGLITFLKTRLIKFYLNSYLMTDPICLHCPVLTIEKTSTII